MKRTGLMICCTLCMMGLFAQEQSIPEKKNNEFGIHAGATTGIGLSYRYWPGKLGLQLTVLPIKTTDMTWISTGLSGLVNFYDAKYVRFYGYLGNHFIIHNYKTSEWDSNTTSYITTNKTERTYNIGFGPGFGFGTIVRFNIMIGYGFFDILNSFNMYPTGEMGLYFRF